MMVSRVKRQVDIGKKITLLVSLCLFFSAQVFASGVIPVRYNADHTVAAMTIDAATAQMVREFIDQMQRNGGMRDATAVVSLVGAVPELVIMGNSSSAVEKLVNIMQTVLADADKQRNLIVITATLHQLSRLDAENVGLNLVPNSLFYQARRSYSISSPSENSQRANQAYLQAQSGNLLQLDDALSRSKILVSSEVYTPNGMKGQISSVQRVPVFAVDKNGNVNTQYQDLETSIIVTPTLVHYDAENPEKSNVRMDVAVKVAIISGTRKMQSISAPEYAVKTLNTTQIIKGTGESVVVGNFISDAKITSRSGIPILSSLPLLKYLFGQESTQDVREVAVLTLAVRVLPTEEEMEKKEEVSANAGKKTYSPYTYIDDPNAQGKANKNNVAVWKERKEKKSHTEEFLQGKSERQERIGKTAGEGEW